MQKKTHVNSVQKPQAPPNSLTFIHGIQSGTPIAIGYIPIAIAFGLLAKSAGIANYLTVLMSVIVFAGASQFVAVKLIALGVASWEVIMTTFVLNLRHFLMTSSLAPRIAEGAPKGLLILLAFGVTDETFSVASLKKEKTLSPQFLLGLNCIAYISWVGGTCLGVFLASGLPQLLQSSMGIALYAMFIGLLVPSFRESKNIMFITLCAVIINTLLNWLPTFYTISTGWCIIISTIIAAAVGALLFPKGVNK